MGPFAAVLNTWTNISWSKRLQRDYKAVVPQPFGQQGLVSWKTNFSRDQMGGMGVVSAGNATNGKRQRKKLCSLACPLLTSCCAVQFLTGRRPVSVLGLGVGEPCCEQVKVTVHTFG